MNNGKSLSGREANEPPRGAALRFDPDPAIRYPISWLLLVTSLPLTGLFSTHF